MAKIEVKRIIKVGNSYAVTLSKQMLSHLSILLNDYISMRLTKDKIEIKRLKEN